MQFFSSNKNGHEVTKICQKCSCHQCENFSNFKNHGIQGLSIQHFKNGFSNHKKIKLISLNLPKAHN